MKKRTRRNTTWKSAERRVGALIGLPAGKQREGPTGLFDCISGEELKVDGNLLGVEVKYKGEVPDWLYKALDQADEHAEAVLDDDACEIDPVVVIVPHHASDADFICALRFTDYIKLRTEAAEAQQQLAIRAEKLSKLAGKCLRSVGNPLQGADGED